MSIPVHSSPNLSVFDDIARAKAESRPPRPEVSRTAGVAIGALTGLTYVLAARLIQAVSLPGVPLAPGPLGFWGLLLGLTAAGALIGGLLIWPTALGSGLFLSSTAVLLAVIAWLALRGSEPLSLLMPDNPSVYLLIISMVLLAMVVPFLLLLRVAAEAQGENWYQPLWQWQRLRLPLIVLMLAALCGVASQPTSRGQQALLRMNTMIGQARTSASPTSLPAPLQRTANVLEHAHNRYQLRLSTDPNLRSQLSHNLAPHDQLILADFDDGWTLACLFKDGVDIVLCGGYEGR